MSRFLTTHKNWKKMQDYARYAYDKWKAEIGGMAVMVESPEDSEKNDIKKGDWVLLDPVILKQEVSGGNCDLDKDALAEYYGKYAMKYKKHNFRFCWWHSHHTMAAFWSGTDLKAIDEFNEGDVSFALVINLKEEYKFRVSVWRPIEVHEDVEFEIINYPESKIPKTVQNEVEKLCTKETPVVSSGWKNGWGHTTGYKLTGNQQQATLWDNTKPSTNDSLTIPHDSEVGLMSPTQLQDYVGLLEDVKRLNQAYINGEIKYNAYKMKINAINSVNLESGIDFEVVLLEEHELFTSIQHQDDADFVEYLGDVMMGGNTHGV